MFLPWVVLFRITVNVFFEHYSLSFLNFHVRDIGEIILHNMVPTVLLVAMRFLAPVEAVRIPLSMIVTEYVITTLGFIVVRFVFFGIGKRKLTISIGYKRRILFLGTKSDIDAFVDLEKLRTNENCLIKGILNFDAIEWNTDYQGIRIFGGLSELGGLLAADDALSSLCVVNPGSMTRKKRKEMVLLAREYYLDLFEVRNNTLIPLEMDATYEITE